ncbi:unnamed protein product [Vitrella brassicaformis CCMP3155]|uniref:Uncharacterized protein n=2 Tax=Vitrella brassicaformis TaxID=1169539 RepID=A0A0G4GH99_VITBC|nr:unnamed protein product [Vitrella brassicaformis CCMP3155]|eukprot:CEM28856.1 unnamed protein product [Vitrella brassicaformis CCMP3155]
MSSFSSARSVNNPVSTLVHQEDKTLPEGPFVINVHKAVSVDGSSVQSVTFVAGNLEIPEECYKLEFSSQAFEELFPPGPLRPAPSGSSSPNTPRKRQQQANKTTGSGQSARDKGELEREEARYRWVVERLVLANDPAHKDKVLSVGPQPTSPAPALPLFSTHKVPSADISYEERKAIRQHLEQVEARRNRRLDEKQQRSHKTSMSRLASKKEETAAKERRQGELLARERDHMRQDVERQIRERDAQASLRKERDAARLVKVAEIEARRTEQQKEPMRAMLERHRNERRREQERQQLAVRRQKARESERAAARRDEERAQTELDRRREENIKLREKAIKDRADAYHRRIGSEKRIRQEQMQHDAVIKKKSQMQLSAPPVPALEAPPSAIPPPTLSEEDAHRWATSMQEDQALPAAPKAEKKGTKGAAVKKAGGEKISLEAKRASNIAAREKERNLAQLDMLWAWQRHEKQRLKDEEDVKEQRRADRAAEKEEIKRLSEEIQRSKEQLEHTREVNLIKRLIRPKAEQPVGEAGETAAVSRRESRRPTARGARRSTLKTQEGAGME